MARYSATQIYAFARAAGFDPDEAVTMTAIALAESGGRSTAHATRGEDSQGLWQVNARAHPDLAGKFDLWDPKQNALAAFEISRGGRDVSPWTTTHGGTRAAYVRFRTDAQAAAAAHGDQHATGIWTGTSGYGHALSAGGESGDLLAPEVETIARDTTESDRHGVALAADEADPMTQGLTVDVTPEDRHGVDLAPDRPDPMTQGLAVDVTPEERHGVPLAESSGIMAGSAAPSGDSAEGINRVDAFVTAALAQRGDRYRMGATAKLDDPDPRVFDCSELVHWASHRAGIDMVDGALPQYLDLQRRGLTIPVDEAIHTKGALLFTFSSPPSAKNMRPAAAHVAISLGNGQTIEARGKAYGVDTFAATTKRFQYAAVLPGAYDQNQLPSDSQGLEVQSSATSTSAVPEADSVPTGGRLLDTDGDGLADRLERRLGLDPHGEDTDHDLLSDSYELLFAGTDPLSATAADDAWNEQADAALSLSDDMAENAPDDEDGTFAAPRHGVMLLDGGPVEGSHSTEASSENALGRWEQADLGTQDDDDDDDQDDGMDDDDAPFA